MDTPSLKQKRMHLRQSTISGPLPGKLIEAATNRAIDAWPLDVSPRGLGVLVKTPLTAGGRFIFELSDRKISLEVVNCQPHLGIDNLYRAGLFVRDPDQNLQAIFIKLGLVVAVNDQDMFSRL